MREQVHLMVDIETMSSSPKAAVIAIGARLFTMKNGPSKGFEVFIDQTEAIKLGEVSIDTMNWWAKQVARELVFGGKTAPAEAAYKFIQFVEEHKPDTIWANSPQFDCVILRHLFSQVQLKFPFHYRDERDFRTMKAAAVDLRVNLDGCWEGLTAHSPLDDATAQAKAMTICLNRLLSTQEARSDQGSVPAPRATLHLPASDGATPSANPQ